MYLTPILTKRRKSQPVGVMASGNGTEPEHDAEGYKKLFQAAYDSVGKRNPIGKQPQEDSSNTKSSPATTTTASPGGAASVDAARIVMKRLGYSPAQLELVGDAVSRMQGVGNPHTAAKICQGTF